MKIFPSLIFGALVIGARAEEAEGRSLLTSPRGTFLIEEFDEAEGPADWVVSMTDSKLRARLTKPHDAEPHTFTFSPDEKWICADVHYGSRMCGVRLYRRKAGVKFEQVIDDGAVWKFIEKTVTRKRTGAEMIRFVGWSPDSARVVFSVPVAAGTEEEGRIWPWYFYYNLRDRKFDLTGHLRGINERTLRTLAKGTSREGLSTVVTGEPVDPLPPAGIRARYEESDRQLNELYQSVMEREKPEGREGLRNYQRNWLTRRDAGAREFSASGPKSESESRRLQHLADANEVRLRELAQHFALLR